MSPLQSQEHIPSGVHARPMKGLRVGPEWEDAKTRAWDEGVTLSYAMAQILEAYASRRRGFSIPKQRGDVAGPSRSIRVAPELWERVRVRAVPEGFTPSRAAAQLLIAYAQRKLDLPRLPVAPRGGG